MKYKLTVLFLAVPAIFVAMDDSPQQVAINDLQPKPIFEVVSTGRFFNAEMGSVEPIADMNTSANEGDKILTKKVFDLFEITSQILRNQLQYHIKKLQNNRPARCEEKCQKGCRLFCGGLALCSCACCCDYSKNELEKMG